jgi:D-alanyl-D-alanine carboxypeptidase/D-alanyl-D-alanine-endopeptidase (penicillin-binding protein 4)
MNKNAEKQNLVLIFLYLIFVSACFSPDKSSQSETTSPIGEENFEVSDTNINLAQPLTISNQPKDVALCEKINQTIEESEFANARWGVIAIGLKDGRVACEKEARKLFNPASIQKLLTSIVALEKLGAGFQFQTKVLSNKTIENGILDGDLTIYGQGAPDFNEEDLEKLVEQLQAKGLKKIKGNIIGDESFFKGDNLGDGWTWNDVQWYYGAEASALSINQNQGSVNVRNGKARASTDYIQVSRAVKPIADIEAAGLKRGLADNQVYVWGNANNLNARISINNPALWAAEIFKKALEKKGISVEGETKSADWKSENNSNTTEFARIESQTLGEIVRRMNKDSINLYAELILRTLGKQFGDAAPNENPKTQALRGDGSAGASVIKKWLTENNVATDEIKIHDGSGLSRLNFVTPEAFGRALIYAAQSKFAEEFKNSLPIAGTDGTLRGRLGNVRGKVLAKTGSITYVNALAGYAKSSTDETFAFVIICNNETRKADSSSVIDSIVTILTEE